MIQIRAENRLTLDLVNESDSSSNDVRTFSTLIRKCRDEANKPGFTNMFNDDEKNLIRMISNQILPSSEQDVNIQADRKLIEK